MGSRNSGRSGSGRGRKNRNKRKRNRGNNRPENPQPAEEQSEEEEDEKSEKINDAVDKVKEIYDQASDINDIGVTYQRMIANLRSRGFNEQQIKQAQDTIFKNYIPGSSRLDRMSNLADAQKLFNPGLSKDKSLQAAEMMVPVLTRYDVASKMLDPGYDSSKDVNRGTINGLVASADALNDPQRASAIADGVFKYTNGTNQTIDGAKTEAFLANQNPASRNQNIHSLFSVLEPVISNVGGDETANGLQAASDYISGKKAISAASRREIARLGMANPRGTGQSASLSTLQNTDVASYVQKLQTNYRAHKISSSAAMQHENSLLFGSAGAKVYNQIIDAQNKTQPGYDSAKGVAAVVDDPINHALMAKDQVAKAKQDAQLSLAQNAGVMTVFSKGEDLLSRGLSIGSHFIDNHPLLSKLGVAGAAVGSVATKIPGVLPWLKKKALLLGGPLKRAGGYLGRMAVDVAKNKLPALARAAWPVLTDIVPEALGAILAPEIILPAAAVAAAGYGAYKLYNYLKKDPSKGAGSITVAAAGIQGGSSPNVSDSGVAPPDVGAQYPHLPNQSAYPDVPMKPSATATQPVNLLMTSEGRQVLIATIMRGISNEAAKPRSGISGFDPSQLLMPAGSVSKIATN